MAINARRRIHYLDALRGFLMMYGVLVHTAALGEHWLLRGVIGFSGLFRMEAFFLIAGFFAALQLSTVAPSTYRVNRVIALGVPLVVMLGATSVVTNHLVATFKGGPLSLIDYLGLIGSGDVFFIWHLHLWFLFSLLFYVLCAPLLQPLIQGRMVKRLLAWGGGPVMLVGMVVAVVGMRGAYELSVKPLVVGTPIEFLVRVTLQDSPYFLLGMCVYHVDKLRDWFERPRWFAAGITLLLIGGYRYVGVNEDSVVHDVIRLALDTLAALVLTNGAWALFKRVLDRPYRTVRFLADASYTVYLLHYLVIAILVHLVPLSESMALTRFVLICTLTYAVTLSIHARMVGPSPLLSLLLNGKRMKVAVPQVRPA